MTSVPMIRLHDGHSMPALGYGVWKIPDNEAEAATAKAIEVGYRAIDTARIYENEAGVGRAVRQSGVARSELYVTTKLWNADQGFDATLKAFDASLARLGLDYVDLYLIHWPAPKKGLYVDTWKALVELKKQGRAKSVGVSNFEPEHLKHIIDETGEVPAVNQIELHPKFTQLKHRAFHEKHHIVTESWSPLGQGKILTDPALLTIAKAHQRTVAQVILRWHLQHDFMVIPKSATPARIAENFAVFDFTLTGEEMTRIDGLHGDEGRIGPNPMTATF